MLQSLHYQAINEVVLVVNKPDRFLFVFCSMCQRTRATRTQWGVPSCIAPPSARPRARPCTATTSPEQTGSSFWLWSPALERTLKSCKEKVLHPMTSYAHSDVNLYFCRCVQQRAGCERGSAGSRRRRCHHGQRYSWEESPLDVWLSRGAACSERGSVFIFLW